MPKKLLKKRASEDLSPKLLKLRQELAKRVEVKDVAREAANAANRQDTVVKNAIKDALEEVGANMNDAIILDGQAISFRPNVTTMIDPRTWHRWYTERRISENQYFGALGVIVSEAQKAIGEDQLPDITVQTLTKTSDVRIADIAPEDATVHVNGDIIPFSEPVPTKEQVKQKPVAASPAPPSRKVHKRIVRIGK